MSEPAIVIEGLSKLYKVRGKKLSVTSLWRRRQQAEMQLPDREVEDDDDIDEEEDEPEEEPEGPPREVMALDDISLEIAAGTRMALLGPPASGKTTLLRVLTRLTPPSSGRAIVRGRVAPLLEVATAFMNPYTTGRANAFQLGRLLGVPHAVLERNMAAIFELAAMDDKVDHLAGTYSSAQYRRVGVATVLNVEADIILVDERLVAGDAEFADRCAQHLRAAAERGVTLLYAAREPEDAAPYCNEALWLAGGRVLDRGPLTETVVPGLKRITRTDRPPGLRALSTEQTELLERLLVERMSYAEAAAATGTTEAAVREAVRAAFDVLAPDGGRLDDDVRQAVADHLLGQPSADPGWVFARAEARAWARMLTLLVEPLAPGALADFPRQPPDLEAAALLGDVAPPLHPSAAALADFLGVALGERRARDAVTMASDKAVWKDLSTVKWADVAEAAGMPHDEAKAMLEQLLTLRSRARLGDPEAHAFDGRVSLLESSLRRPTGERVEVLRDGEHATVETVLETSVEGVELRLEIVLDGDGVPSLSLAQPEAFRAEVPGRYRVRARLAGVKLRDSRYTARVVLFAELAGREEVLETTDAFAFEVYDAEDDPLDPAETAGAPIGIAWEVTV